MITSWLMLIVPPFIELKRFPDLMVLITLSGVIYPTHVVSGILLTPEKKLELYTLIFPILPIQLTLFSTIY